MESSDKRQLGKVFLVGAGPGDAGLVTLRGVQCLQRADTVLFDYLVNPQIVEHAPPHAEKICLGQTARGRSWTQEEVNQRLVQDALEGRNVVHLKGGDPAVFGREAEEAECLAQQGIPIEIVPGVTAALAAGSYAGIPVTHRDLASAVALIAGHEKADKEDGPSLDYEALARFPGTLVVYMGVTSAGQWSQALIRAGKPPQTPVAIIRRCSLPDQRTLVCTLGEVGHVVAAHRELRPPAIVIVGEVVRRRDTLCWFEKQPLFGTRVMVTRPAEQMDVLCRPLMDLGAEVIRQPAITISPPHDWAPVDSALARLESFDWLVFSSANGVRFFLDRLAAGGRDLRALASVRLASIGPGTTEALDGYRLRADLQPEATYRAESLAAEFADQAAGRRFLLVRASRGREVLAEELQRAGGQVEQVVTYQSEDVTTVGPTVREHLEQGSIDWITVTSSAIGRSLVQLLGDQLRASRLVTISPVTSHTLRQLGFEPTAEASEYTMRGVVEAIVRHPGR